MRSALAPLTTFLLLLLAAPAAAQQPNIILILSDDLGYGNLGSYGQQLIQTPELDQMAAEGMRFTSFHAGSPVCLPSRCTLMTGLHQGHCSVHANGGNGNHQPLKEEDIVLARTLQAAGYRTGMIGKWALGDEFIGNTVAEKSLDGTGAIYKHGWEYYYGEPNQSYVHDYYPDHLYEFDLLGIVTAPTGAQLVPRPINDYSHDLLTEKALEFIDANADDPFFLYIPYTIGHFDWVVPELEPYAEGTNWSNLDKNFASMVTRMDRDIGRIIERLQQHGIDENTLVIFTSDNGGDELFVPQFDINGGLEGDKAELSDGGLMVPFIARWPGSIAPGTSSDELLAFWDVMPTLLGLTTIDAPAPLDGISFLPTLLGMPQVERHDYLYFRYAGDHLVKRNPWETRSDEEIIAEAFTGVVVPAWDGDRSVVSDCDGFGPGVGTLQHALFGDETPSSLCSGLTLIPGITFACDGVIAVPELEIACDSVIDASGRDVTLSGEGANRIFSVGPDRTLELRSIELANGRAPVGDGGAIFTDAGTVVVTDSVLCDNAAEGGSGGAIGNDGGTVTIAESTLCRNSAESGGGVGTSAAGTLQITRSLLWDNTAIPGPLSNGGAIDVSSGGTLSVSNSTLSGNTASMGAGISLGGSPLTATITSSTIAFNDGGGLFGAGSETLTNSIVADNIGGDCLLPTTDAGHNLDSDGSCGLTEPSSLSNTDPWLDVLADNSGPTLTHALLPGSPAIDAIPTLDCTYDDDGDPATPEVLLLWDQRGVLRGGEGNGVPPRGCDIGAYEVKSTNTCGLGAELTLLLPLLMWGYRRRIGTSPA